MFFLFSKMKINCLPYLFTFQRFKVKFPKLIVLFFSKSKYVISAINGSNVYKINCINFRTKSKILCEI